MNKLKLIALSLITMSAAFAANLAVAGHHEDGETMPATVVALAVGAEGTLSLIHISEPTRRTPISYAVFCLKKKK